MSIASAIAAKQQQVASAYASCNDRGATMPSSANQNLSNLAATIETIPTSGGSSTTYKVYWFDYDGTVLKEDTVVEGGSSSAPVVPTHQYLQFEEWVHGNTITDVTQDYFNIARYSCTETYVIRKVNIGADQDFRLRVFATKVNNDPVVIDWGDGNTDTVTSSTNVEVEHIYASAFSGYVKMYSSTGKSITTTRNNSNIYELGVEEYYFGSNSVISDYAFLGCHNPYIKAVVLPNGLTQLRRNLFTMYSPKVLAVPPTVTSFEATLFSGLRRGDNNLVAINIPTNTTTLGTETFADIVTLKYITKDLYVTSFGQRAFGNTDIGGELTFKSSVTSFGNSAFLKVARVKKISLATGTFTTIGSYSSGAFADCPELEEIVFPATLPITNIGNGCFSNSVKLKTITNFPKNATTVGNTAFMNCYELTTPIEFTNVTSMGTGVFTGCHNLTSIKLGGTFTELSLSNNGFFADCWSLTTVEYPNTVTTFGNAAFLNCYNLTSIPIPTSLTTIGNTAFSTNSRLEQVILPETAVTIGSGLCSNCHGLKKIYFGLNTTISNTSNFLANCGNLMEIDCAQGWRPTVDITFSNSLHLYEDMLENFFTHLGDNTGYTSRKITIGAINLNRLSSAQKAIATGKNYTLA